MPTFCVDDPSLLLAIFLFPFACFVFLPEVNDYGVDLDGFLNSLMRVVCPALILYRHGEEAPLRGWETIYKHGHLTHLRSKPKPLCFRRVCFEADW